VLIVVVVVVVNLKENIELKLSTFDFGCYLSIFRTILDLNEIDVKFNILLTV
jgi:hypothetical protein